MTFPVSRSTTVTRSSATNTTMTTLCLLLLAAAVASVAAHETLTPVVFLPGYFGSQLFVTVADKSYLPEPCLVDSVNIPIGEPFAAMYNATLLLKAPDCVYQMLRTDFKCPEEGSECQFVPLPGITVSSNDFGGFKGIEPVYASFPRQLLAWGYTPDVNMFGAPYDYRFMSSKSLIASGLVKQLTDLVEKAYKRGGNRKVAILGHSNGGPTLYSFLTAHGQDSSVVPQQWKDKYIAAFIGLSGNFLGQMNGYKAFTYSEIPGEQDMATTWEAAYGSAPWGGYASLQGTNMITKDGASSEATVYTPQLPDTHAMLLTSGRPEWATRLMAVNGYVPVASSAPDAAVEYKKVGAGLDRTAHPLVDTYCLYGTNVSTSYGFVFPLGILDGAATETLYMEGDGNQDILDNRFCNVWADDAKAQQAGFVFEATEFPNVQHMQMYSDEAVLQKIHEILTKYSKQPRSD